MKQPSRYFGISIILVSFLWLCTSVRAHDLILFPAWKVGKLSIVAKYGHPGDWQFASLDKLLELTVIAPDGSQSDWRTGLKNVGLDLQGSTAKAWQPGVGTTMFSSRFDNGLWVELADGSYRNARKSAFTDVKKSLSSFKYAKALIWQGKRDDNFQRVVGHDLEIVPMADPFAATVGRKLPVKVLLRGKPLANIGLEIRDGATPLEEKDIPRYATNAEGIAEVPIDKAGWQVIGVDYEEPSPNTELVDMQKIVATLSFHLDANRKR